MGLKIDLAYAVNTLVDQLLPHGENHNHGEGEVALYVCIRVSFSKYYNGEQEDKNVTRFAHFLFSRPTNYTQVMMAIGSHRMPPVEEFQHQSYHDTCWRSDGYHGLRIMELEMVKAMELETREWPSEFVHIEEVRKMLIHIDRPFGTNYNRKEHWKVTKIERLKC